MILADIVSNMLEHKKISRGLIISALFAGLAACASTPVEDAVSIDPAQGSVNNIASLTAVV